MGNEVISIKEKIAAPKLPMRRKEKADSREAIKRLASQYTDGAIKKLWEIASAKDTPATARVQSVNSLIERVAGKASAIDRPETEQDEYKKMSEAELLSTICETIAGLSQESQGLIAESILASQRGLSMDFTRMVPHDFSETEALRAEAREGLPPLEKPKPPRKEPKR